MIKLTKTSWILLVIGIFIIALAGLGMAYSEQGREQSRLNQELSQARLILSTSSPHQLSSQKQELERRLTQAQSELETAKASLSQSIESIEASDTLFDIARVCDVEITEISPSAPTYVELQGVNYSALSLTVQVEGDVANLVDFIHKWTEEYSTGEVKSVEIVVPVSEEETEGEEAEKPSANIKLLIYTYRGD